MSTALDVYASSSLSDRKMYAETLAGAGDLIPKGLHEQIRDPQTNAVKGTAPSPGKVLLAMEYGAMLGLPPIAAVQGIHVIEGKASPSAQIMAAVVRYAGHRLRVTTAGTWAQDDFVARAELVRSDDPEFTYVTEWTVERARAAGLLGKDNWGNYGSQMAVNRAVSEVCRQGAQDALLGAVYTPEELGATVDMGGNFVAEGGSQETASEPQAEAQPERPKRATSGRQGTKRGKPAEPKVEDIVDAEVVPDEPAEEAPAGPAPKPDADPGECMMWELNAQGLWAIVRDPKAGPTKAEAQEEERAERERMAAEQTANAERLESEAEAADDVPMYAADDTTPPPSDADAPSAEEEPPYELQAPEYVDAQGTVYESQEAMDAGIRAQREQRTAEAPAAPEAERTPAGPGADWTAMAEAATTVPDLQGVWDDAVRAGEMTTELRLVIVNRKAELEAASA